jgi:hypothetical protein
VVVKLPEDVSGAVRTFLAAVDHGAEGLVEALYVHGSLGFGEYMPGRSDVDAVVVLSRRASDADLAVLEFAHRSTADQHPRQTLEAVHVLWEDLRGPADQCPDAPNVSERTFSRSGRFELSPVTWHGVARHSVAVRGPDPGSMGIHVDDDELRAYTRDNLATYWTDQLARVRANPAGASAPWASEWCVLGVARLHHVLATGAMTSKSGAGRYALTAFTAEWAPIVQDALTVREHADRTAPFGDGSDGRRGPRIADFLDMVIGEGLSLGTGTPSP